MSINHFSTDLQETPWWQQHPQQLQQSMMETAQSSTSSPSSATTPQQQQFSSWPSPRHHHHHHQFYHHQQQQQQQHQLWLNSYNNNNNNSHHSPTLSFNLSNQRDATEEQAMTNTNSDQEQELEKEPMFEKPLTPSDVGKLNRLVIPKQHAEKYFPLGGGADPGSSSDKGLLLSFEDESGKHWRFRYSYWNSSQSYVLTKGWSRYVKEKRLDAGDVILFERHRTDSERLFIGWRRRGSAAAAQDAQSAGAAAGAAAGGGGGGGGSSGWPRGFYSNHPYPVDAVQGHDVSVPLYHHAGSGVQGQTMSVGSSRTLRLFGVDLEYQLDDESEGSESQAQAQAHAHQQFSYSMEAYHSNSTAPHGHMDITFSQEDVNRMMRNRQG